MSETEAPVSEFPPSTSGIHFQLKLSIGSKWFYDETEPLVLDLLDLFIFSFVLFLISALNKLMSCLPTTSSSSSYLFIVIS